MKLPFLRKTKDKFDIIEDYDYERGIVDYVCAELFDKK